MDPSIAQPLRVKTSGCQTQLTSQGVDQQELIFAGARFVLPPGIVETTLPRLESNKEEEKSGHVPRTRGQQNGPPSRSFGQLSPQKCTRIGCHDVFVQSSTGFRSRNAVFGQKNANASFEKHLMRAPGPRLRSLYLSLSLCQSLSLSLSVSVSLSLFLSLSLSLFLCLSFPLSLSL